MLTAHVVASAIDAEPVSLSRQWTEYLRGPMGFDGVIITDALDMDAVAEGRGTDGVADAAVRALRAGADLLCLGSNFDESMTDAVIDRVVAALDDAELKPAELERSVERIAALRRPSSPLATTHPEAGMRAAQRVAQGAIDVAGRLPAGPFAVLECGRVAACLLHVTWASPMCCMTTVDISLDHGVGSFGRHDPLPRRCR